MYIAPISLPQVAIPVVRGESLAPVLGPVEAQCLGAALVIDRVILLGRGKLHTVLCGERVYNVVPVLYLVVPTLQELVVTDHIIPGFTSVDIELLCLHVLWCYSETL